MNFRKGMIVAGIGLVAASLVAAPATGAPGKGKAFGKAAAKACSAEKKAIGQEAFDELYGKPSQPNCIGVKATEAAPILKNAAKECKAEGLKGKEYGKCVSRRSGKKVKKAIGASKAEVVNAAQACRTEQADANFAASHDGKTFDQFYGTNANLKNAFGKCVSSKAKAAQEPAPTA